MTERDRDRLAPVIAAALAQATARIAARQASTGTIGALKFAPRRTIGNQAHQKKRHAPA